MSVPVTLSSLRALSTQESVSIAQEMRALDNQAGGLVQGFNALRVDGVDADALHQVLRTIASSFFVSFQPALTMHCILHVDPVDT